MIMIIKIKSKNDSTIMMSSYLQNLVIGCDITIPIKNGQLQLGTWQGIWFCEHLENANARNIIVTINGSEK